MRVKLLKQPNPHFFCSFLAFLVPYTEGSPFWKNPLIFLLNINTFDQFYVENQVAVCRNWTSRLCAITQFCGNK
jgi:hypothetical protein